MTIPAHVPADRVFDFNIYDFAVDGAEYQAGMQQLLQGNVPEIFWTPHNGGHWVVTRSQQINEVLNDHEHFSSRQIVVPKPPIERPPLKPLQVDPPQHLKYRNLLAAALSPKAVASLAESARVLAIQLIEEFKPRGECEFVSEFAQHLPVAIFMNIVDLPEQDRGLLTGLAEIVVREEDERLRGDALMKIAGYGMQKIIERRAKPGNDLLSSIAIAKVDGELLNDYDLTGMLTLLLLAGLDTVASMMGFFARFFALNPAHRRQLIEDPSLINNAVEELLRRYPIANLAREVTQDFEYHGVCLKTGDMVVVPTALDGLDERRFEVPLTVDFNRDKPIHATFGGGVHRCMGSMLARTELRLFIEEWLKRIPDFEIKPGTEVKFAARAVATITSLPLVWSPTNTL
ncbi:cytochrome P450 [Pseudomonas umsongensis]|uniref:cytochrome P450 n=1 Tax=Pseudomonas umsongensis TaxID=198618 RepID=UPI002009FBDF|nr:cytochrome P450 [Pseudomonas umsongensis]MCK8682684.1 cytochrome P450 [Pseudomonas umsongensis]